MAAKARLVAPLCVVVMDDGAEYEVQSSNWDLLLYERTARKRNWPAAQDAPLEAATFVAWSALRREAMISAELTYEAFGGTDSLPGRAISVETKRVTASDPTRQDQEEG